MKNKITPKQTKYLFLFGCLIFYFTSCRNTNKPKKKSTETIINLCNYEFNEDSAFKYVQLQTEFGPRVPNTLSHKKCGVFLAKTLYLYGFDTIIQKAKVESFDKKTLNIYNIIGSYNKSKKQRILLCAHWDTRPFSDQSKKEEERTLPIIGANDGASGVGVLIEVARQIQKIKPNIGIDIIFFDAEDYGPPEYSKNNITNPEKYWCLGSQYWSNNPHKFNYSAEYGILLDMVGTKNPRFLKEQFSYEFARYHVNKIWRTAKKLGYGKHFINNKYNTPSIIDDHYFINVIRGIPTLDIIHTEKENNNFHESWHTQQDNINIIDKESLKIVGKVILENICLKKKF